MVLLVEFLLAVGIIAIAGSLIYTGYRLGKNNKEEK